ncbi:MAG: hypothetical protein NTY19_26285 [Planctomycetota bacterium]|nr:hypothetical protein [Planctomycetota bacterium]
MLKRLQTDQSLARYAGWFIPLKIETNGEEWGKWASRFRHEGSTIPIIFVVRADGQQLFGKSGALPGLELPQLIEQVIQQAGTIYSDQQLKLLKTSLDRAKQEYAAHDVAGAVRDLSKLSQLGSLGKLGSYSEVAIEADNFAQQLIEQGRSDLAAAKQKLGQPETRLEGALALAATRRGYLALPPLKNEIVAAVNSTRANADLRDSLKLAEQLDEARDQLQKPTGRRRALTALLRIVSENSGTPAATLAADWIREHDPAAAGMLGQQQGPATAKQFHEWTSDKGTAMEAVLVASGHAQDTQAPYVVLETREGKRVTVPYARLSAASQTLAKELVRKLPGARSKD